MSARALGVCISLVGAGCSLVNEYPQVRDADEASRVSSALSASAPGDFVRITGPVSGSFTVPEGVTVLGTERGVLEVPAGEVGLTLAGGPDPAQPTVVRDLRIVSSGKAGLVARGGHLELDGVDVEVTGAGVAALITDVAGLRASEMTLLGDQPQGIFRDRTESSGLVLVRVARAELERVDATAFGRANVALVESTVSWSEGSATGAGRIGLTVHTSSVTLRDVDASGVRGLDALAAVSITGDSDVTADGLEASLSANYGVVQFGGRARFARLRVRANDGIGVVVQDATSAELEVLSERNFAAGLLAVDVARLRLEDSVLREHARSEVVAGPGVVIFGDGAQIVRSFSDLRLDGLEVDQSFRVGLLLVAENQRLEANMFQDVRITGSDDQLGAIRLGGEADPDWDQDILRSPAVLANDAAQQGDLPFFDRLDPTPFTAFATSVAERGLDAVAAP